MNFNRNLIFTVLLFPVFATVSFYLISNYVYGDQVHYRALYSELSHVPFSEAMSVTKRLVSGGEPATAWLLWLGSSLGIEKDIYITIFNVFLLFVLTFFLKREEVGWFTVFLILTNFYLIVLMTGAERLKFGYLFVLLAAISRDNLRWFFLLLAPFAHLQMLIFLFGFAIGHFSSPIKKIITDLKISKRSLKVFLSALIAVTLVLSLLGKAILLKAEKYEASGISEIFQVLVLLVVALFVAKDKFRVFLVVSSMIVFVMLLGGSRVNMIAFSLVLYFITLERRVSSPLFLLLLAYFSYKSVGFVYNVLEHGNGFV